MANDLGSRVRAARERLKWTQQELADRAGVSQATIDKIERGLTKHSRHIIQISRALNIDVFALHEHGDFIKSISPPPEAVPPAESENIPVFKSTLDKILYDTGFVSEHGHFLLDITPFDYIEKDSNLSKGNALSYGIYIGNDFMTPEIDEGDIVIVDPKAPVIKGSTCVFCLRVEMPKEDGIYMEMRVIGRLLESPGEDWRVLLHSPAHALLLPKAAWKTIHRVVAKHYRN